MVREPRGACELRYMADATSICRMSPLITSFSRLCRLYTIAEKLGLTKYVNLKLLLYYKLPPLLVVVRSVSHDDAAVVSLSTPFNQQNW